MKSTKYSKAAAARIIGKSRATIARHIKSGKLTSELDQDENEVLDASELYRVYGDACDFEREEKRGQIKETPRSDAVSNDAVTAMQKQLTRQYESEIEHLKQALDKALDVTKLLEDRSSETNAWQGQLDAMSEKIANQTEKQIATLKQEHDEQILRLRRALYKERNKSFWQRLFR